MSDKKLRSALIRLANEKPELRADLLPLVKRTAQTVAIPKRDVDKLKRLVREAESLAESIMDTREEESKTWWYWHDIYQALADISGSL